MKVEREGKEEGSLWRCVVMWYLCEAGLGWEGFTEKETSSHIFHSQRNKNVTVPPFPSYHLIMVFISGCGGRLRYSTEQREADKAHPGTPVRTLIAAIYQGTLSEIRDPHLGVPCSRQETTRGHCFHKPPLEA